MTSGTQESIADREIIISRRYDAPPALVWRALTEREHVAQWWGPDGFTLTTAEMDVRVGGVWRFTMHGPDGVDYPNLIQYHIIREPELLGFTHSDDENGEIAFEASITLAAADGGTELTLRQVHPTKEARDYVVREHGAIEGGKQTLARLAEHLKSMR
jgi:uncharacterized protein YndB with AHSA1/START domain